MATSENPTRRTRRFAPVFWLIAAVVCGGLFAPVDADRADDDGVANDAAMQLVQIDVRNREQFQAILSTGAIPAACRPNVGPGAYFVTPEQRDAMDAMNVNYNVRIDDVDSLIKAERERIELNRARNAGVARNGGSWFDDFKTYNEINAYLTTLQQLQPDIVDKFVIGQSHEFNFIHAIRIGGGENKPAVLFNGGQHAREWVNPMVVMYIADHLIRNYGVDPDITALVDDVEFIIVPMVNPDGYLYSWSDERLWRKNRRDNLDGTFGVDLNRNWSVDWNGGESNSNDPDSDIYVGTAPFSEPETAALSNLVNNNPQIVAHIDFHSFSQLILQPVGYTPELPDDYLEVDALGAAMTQAIFDVHGETYPHGSGGSLIYLASGTCSDWTYEARGIRGYTFELRDTGTFGFLLPPEQIIPNGEEVVPAAIVLAEWARTAPAINVSFPNGRPDLIDPATQVMVEFDASATYADPIDPKQTTLMSRVGGKGPFVPSAATFVGDDTFQVMLPAAPCGAAIEYYLSFETTGRETITIPTDAPATVYSALSVAQTPELTDNFETQQGWFAANQGASSGLWERGVPVNDAGWEYDPTADSDGSGQCWLTQNQLGNTDVDGGAVELFSPLLDFPAGDMRISYDYYLNLTDANGVDAMTVDVSSNNLAGPWIQIARHEDSGGTGWLNHVISQADLDAAGVTSTAAMRMRFTVNDDDPQSIVEAGLDAFSAISIGCPFQTADLNTDGVVDTFDLLDMLKQWGDCAAPCPPSCSADITGDGGGPDCTVDTFDLLELLSQWG